MIAVETNFDADKLTHEDIKKIFGGSAEYHGGIRSMIPTGFNHHSKKQEWEGFNNAPDDPIIQQEIESAKKQLGTLGGGNHFIELQKADDGCLWFMIHSGSTDDAYGCSKNGFGQWWSRR